jgi:hypothetical protein
VARARRAANPKQPKPKGPKRRFTEPYHIRHAEKRKEQQREYYVRVRKEKNKENKEKLNENARKRHAENPEKQRAAQRRWAQKNPAKVAEIRARKKAAKFNATPQWADQEKLAWIYSEAQVLSALHGEKYEVDHIIPLRSKLVCGLHCPDNLRIIPANENRKKSNKWWPDMP